MAITFTPVHLSALCPHKQLHAPHLNIIIFWNTVVEYNTTRVVLFLDARWRWHDVLEQVILKKKTIWQESLNVLGC